METPSPLLRTLENNVSLNLAVKEVVIVCGSLQRILREKRVFNACLT